MDLYFKRHDGQAVTCEDFFSAMRDANNADFSNFLLWYVQCILSHFSTVFATILVIFILCVLGTLKLEHLMSRLLLCIILMLRRTL